MKSSKSSFNSCFTSSTSSAVCCSYQLWRERLFKFRHWMVITPMGNRKPYRNFRVGGCVQWIPIRNDSINGSHDAGIVVHLVNSCQWSNFTIRKEPQPGNIGPDCFMKRFEQGRLLFFTNEYF